MTDRDAERRRTLDALFSEALDVPEDERAAWLERSVDDPSLREELASLLEAAAFTGFMGTRAEAQVARALSSALDASDGSRSGSVLGPYRLGEQVGRGGMADVYRAERVDGAFRQLVAVKIQRRGLDTDDVLARFRAERQILSGLNHPNIARLIDGGATDDGLPYLVMEYVEGLPIDEYCDRHGLPVADRLDLFMQVAHAVQKAHSMLVVHRDIKPSNVLVTTDGEVKLLDFGIAKLLDPAAVPGDAPLTRTGARPHTPRYASPEQVRGEPITTASDIYQLGLLLYRMLTGGLPFDGVPPGGRALEDAITGTQPGRPSAYVETHPRPRAPSREDGAYARRLRGDIDTIVLAALRKEPERRYASAHEMAEDVRRHLQGRPIAARQDSRAYRLRKFLRRNPLVAPAAAGAGAALALYVVTLDRHGREMEAQRNEARLEAEKAEATRDFLVGLFRSADPFAPVTDARRDVRVREVMDEGARRARLELRDRPELQALMLGTIGDVFLGLGDPERATDLRLEALEIARARFGEASPEAVAAERALVDPVVQAGRRTDLVSDSGPIVALRALNSARRAFGPDHVESYRAEVAMARALRYASSGFLAVEPILRHAIDGLRASGVEGPELAEALIMLARTLGSTSEADWPAAERLATEGVTLFRASLGPDHARTLAAEVWLADIMSDVPAALPRLEAAGASLDTLLGPDHDLAIRALTVKAGVLRELERFGESADAQAEVAERRLRAGGDTRWVEMAVRNQAKMALLAGRTDEAIAVYDRLLEGAGGPAPAYRLDRAWALGEAGRTREAFAELPEISAQFGDNPTWQGRVECVRGRLLGVAGDPERAAAAFRTAGELLGERGASRTPEDPCFGVLPDG